MSRVNRFQEGHGRAIETRFVPPKKRKRRRPPTVRLLQQKRKMP